MTSPPNFPTFLPPMKPPPPCRKNPEVRADRDASVLDLAHVLHSPGLQHEPLKPQSPEKTPNPV